MDISNVLRLPMEYFLSNKLAIYATAIKRYYCYIEYTNLYVETLWADGVEVIAQNLEAYSDKYHTVLFSI